MQPAPIHPQEPDRLLALKAVNLLDSLPETKFDQIALLASQICGTPIALITLVDQDRQWFMAKVGVSVSQTPRDLSFCAHTILQEGAFVVEDTTQDARFADNPLVTGDPHVNFYAGIPLLSPGGMPIGAVSVIDTEPRKLSSQQLQSLRALSNQVTGLIKLDQDRLILDTKLADSAKLIALGEMSAGVAHEVNNPLAIIKAKSQLLIRRIEQGMVEAPAIVQDLKSIEATADRIARIVKALKVYSRSADRDSFVKIAVLEVINDTLELCRERFNQSSVQVTVVCEPEITIQCRPTQISQVLMNLVVNSFDAIESLDQKWVKIEVDEHANQVRVRVTDSGSGIAPSVVEKMMDPFFTTKDAGKGTGLGLSISSGIMVAHGGKLDYDPKSEHTTFVMSFPKLDKDA